MNNFQGMAGYGMDALKRLFRTARRRIPRRMRRLSPSRGLRLVGLAVIALIPLIWWGCSQDIYRVGGLGADANAALVRVRLFQDRTQLQLSSTTTATVRASADSASRLLSFPRGISVPVSLIAGGWRIGSVQLGTGQLTITPTAPGGVYVDGQAYRGRYRLTPTGPGRFDVINDVDIDGYLKGVIAKEMLWNWDLEAYKAQAIVARTYALYEARTAGSSRGWDLYPDQRSQVYGGIAAESAKSRQAVDATAGIVVAHGSAGHERIFKAYFSSCCGGITQSAADAFGDAWIAPLSDQNNQSLCSASPRFNWGPVVVAKEELTRRFRLWGARRGDPGRPRPEANMAALSRIDLQFLNRFGRPTRFLITDVRGNRYSLSGEELRTAVNTDAAAGTTLFSSFCKTINDPDQVRFVEGHGHGHGAGMCQWCAQRRAEQGMRHEDIVLAAYPKSRLVRAY